MGLLLDVRRSRNATRHEDPRRTWEQRLTVEDVAVDGKRVRVRGA